MHLNSNLLAVIRPKRGDFVQRPANLFDGLLARYARRETVRLHLHAAAAAVVHEPDVLLRQFDVLLQLRRLGVVEPCVRAVTDQRDRAVGEAALHLGAFGLRETGLDPVRVLGTQFDAEHPGLLTGREQVGHVKILAPQISDQTEAHGRRATGNTGTAGRATRGDGEGGQCSVLEKETAIEGLHKMRS